MGFLLSGRVFVEPVEALIALTQLRIELNLFKTSLLFPVIQTVVHARVRKIGALKGRARAQ